MSMKSMLLDSKPGNGMAIEPSNSNVDSIRSNVPFTNIPFIAPFAISFVFTPKSNVFPVSEATNRKSLEEITKVCIEKYDDITDSRMCIIDAEFRRGFELMKNYPKSVTIFGSARLAPETEMYQRVEALAKKIANLDYTVVTGGGHGIMGAANKGAFEAEKGSSVGINIELPFEQTTNPYLDDTIEFHHFFYVLFLLF